MYWATSQSKAKKNQKESSRKKLLIFPEMELSSSNIKKIHIFFQKKTSQISCTFQPKLKKQKIIQPEIIFYFSGNVNFEKKFLYFLYCGKWNFWVQSLIFFYFFWYFRRKLAKPETFSYLTFFIRNFYVVINKLRLLFLFNNIFTFF